jgi:hypothetical protein
LLAACKIALADHRSRHLGGWFTQSTLAGARDSETRSRGD